MREFFATKAFGREVDLEDKSLIPAMSTKPAEYVCTKTFANALRELTIEDQAPALLTPARKLSEIVPFPWSGPVWEGRNCVFNLVPCDNNFERDFAKFLDGAGDVAAFAKLAQPIGFAIDYTDAALNLRLYYPDFVAVAEDGTRWLLETKGQEDIDVACKDRAARLWCENATALTEATWRYLKVPQKDFEQLAPRTLADLQAIEAGSISFPAE